MRSRSLRFHFLMLYVMLAVLSGIVVPALGVNFSVEAFKRYQAHRRQEDLENLGESLASLYREEGGIWKRRRVMDILHPAPQWAGMSITLYDADSREVFTHRSPTPRAIHNARMNSPYPLPPEDNAEKEYITLELSGNVGRLEVERRLPPGKFESLFLSYLMRYTLSGASIMILCACGLGYIIAGKLSRPVIKAIERTKSIAHGDYDIYEESRPVGIRELDALTRGVEDLGRSLAGQEKLRRRLMVDVAHELRTPLTVTRTQIEAIADGILEPTPERLSLCVDGMKRLGDLIGNVEALSRIEGENLAIHAEPTDMKRFLGAVTESFMPMFAKEGITLTCELDDVTCEIDRDKFRHATDNLLSNALRYTDKGGSVKVKLYERGKDVVIKVSDTGIGISPEDLPNIFERFWRADESRARVTGGSGVGLAIVKAAVEAHGGKISAESVKGEGTCFTITLPRV